VPTQHGMYHQPTDDTASHEKQAHYYSDAYIHKNLPLKLFLMFHLGLAFLLAMAGYRSDGKDQGEPGKDQRLDKTDE
jgi:hypothetical protein